jgi:hypothetical protein
LVVRDYLGNSYKHDIGKKSILKDMILILDQSPVVD